MSPLSNPKALFLLGACLLAGCSGASPNANVSAPPPPPQVRITPGDGSTGLTPDSTITVTADAHLERVTVRQDGDKTQLAGTLDADARNWTLAGGLVPGMRYVIQATATGTGGTTTASARVAVATGQRLITSPMPGNGSTVGVGMPIELHFNASIPPALQTKFLSHIAITTSPQPVKGDWHWWSGDVVHWRPADLWPAGTKATINANLQGVNAGNGFWGFGNWTESFTIGEKHVSTIDNSTHQMQVYKNDALQVTYPVSMGIDSRWPTISGTMYVPYKIQDVQMDSLALTPPIPHGAPGGYFEHVFWDTAISTDGFYIHSAPWSVGSQGVRNVSHGCVNLSEARATEFYKFSSIGDVVIIKNTPRAADQSDGEGDWQIPFAQYPNSGGAAATPAPSGSTSGAGGL